MSELIEWVELVIALALLAVMNTDKLISLVIAVSPLLLGISMLPALLL